MSLVELSICKQDNGVAKGGGRGGGGGQGLERTGDGMTTFAKYIPPVLV